MKYNIDLCKNEGNTWLKVDNIKNKMCTYAAAVAARAAKVNLILNLFLILISFIKI